MQKSITKAKTNPHQALVELDAEVVKQLELLEKTQAYTIQDHYLKAQSDLKILIKSIIEFTSYSISEDAAGRVGVQNDSYGYLKARTQYDKPAWQKRFPKTHHLVNLYCQEVIDSQKVQPEGYNEMSEEERAAHALSPVEVALAMSSDEEVVVVTCNDGSEILFDKENNRVGEKHSNGHVTWTQSKFNLAKDWATYFLNFVQGVFAKVWEYTKKIYKKCVDFIFGE